MSKLTFKNTEQAGTVINLKHGQVRVGRNPQNDIIIPDASVSSFHAELNVSDIGIAVTDLGSTNGTFINKKQVTRGMLQSNDLLTLGAVDFGIEIPTAHIAIPDIPKIEALGAAFLEDGSPGCFVHRTIAATLACTKCENWFCADCARTMKKISGELLYFCPECSAACVPLPQPTTAQKKGFLARLQETLLLKRK